MPGNYEKLFREKACTDCWTQLTFWKTDMKFCVSLKHMWGFLASKKIPVKKCKDSITGLGLVFFFFHERTLNWHCHLLIYRKKILRVKLEYLIS